MAITASDVAKLRNMTGAGMMDCKQALTEAEGDFQAAVDILRKKGQKVANKRADRELSEGATLSKVAADGKSGVIILLGCETDFVAKNDDFVGFANQVLELALTNKPANLEALKALPMNSSTVGESMVDLTGKTGEKVDLSAYDLIAAEKVVAYIHPGNKVSTLVGFNQECADQVGRDVAMQIAAMAPIAVDQKSVSQEMIDREIAIGKELAINEGKAPEMAEKIAIGRLGKFFKESTLLEQAFIKDNKISVAQYLTAQSKGLTATDFKRYSVQA